MRGQERWTEHAAFMDALAADPWTELDLLRISEIRPWEILLSGRS
jgi:hypothetical protein